MVTSYIAHIQCSVRFTHITSGHWTCSFMYHFNCLFGAYGTCSHYGAGNLSHTFPYLSYQVPIYTWVRVKCIAQRHNIGIMSQYWDERTTIFLWKSCTRRDSKPHGKQWHWQHCNHCATSLSAELIWADIKRPSKLIYLNFLPLEVVSRYRDPHPQVVENYS